MMQVCTGVSSSGYWGGGTTWGSTFFTGSSFDSRTLTHEEKHADQWALFGLAFPIMYGLTSIFWRDEHNPFEKWAGLEDGCYAPRPGCH
jgi:hypothetical protein